MNMRQQYQETQPHQHADPKRGGFQPAGLTVYMLVRMGILCCFPSVVLMIVVKTKQHDVHQ